MTRSSGRGGFAAGLLEGENDRRAPTSDAAAVKSSPTPAKARSVLGVLWLFVGIATLWFALNPRIESDGIERYKDIVRLMSGERPVGKFSIIQALFSVPLYVVGDHFGHAHGAVSLFNFCVLIVLLVIVWRTIPQHGLKVALLLLAASMLPAYANSYFAEILTALCVLLGFWFAPKNWLASVAFLAIGVANTPATLPAAGLAALYYFFVARRTSVGVGAIVAGVLVLLETRWKYGAFTTPYLTSIDRGVKTDIMPYSGLPGFSYPILFGVLAILFSFGKGLIFFMPSLPLGLKKFRPSMPPDVDRLVNGLLIFVAGMVLVYSQWWAWYGGAVWGPRLFIIACLPAAILLAFTLNRSASPLVILLLFASGWVAVEGVLYGLGDYAKCAANNYAFESLCWYIPEYSPLLNGFVNGFPVVGAGKIVYAAWCAITLVAMAVSALWGRPRVWYEQGVALVRGWRWKPATAPATTETVDDVGPHVPDSGGVVLKGPE